MKRIELYVDKDRLVLSQFKDVDSEYEEFILKGADTYEYLKKLSNSEIIDIYESKNKKDVVLEFKNYIISLNDYNDLITKRGMKPILNRIKCYYEKESLKKQKSRKVKRKNKYNGSKVLAVGLSFAIMGSCAIGAFNLNNKNIEGLDKPTVSISQSEDKKIVDIIDDNKKSINIETIQIETPSRTTSVSISFNDRSSTEKALFAKENYSNLITKYSRMYGIDPVLAIAVATQESGVHSSVTNKGGATGLMQIQNSVWIGNKVSAYNFQTQTTESLTVTLDKIQNLEYNIKIGCMILQNSLQYMKYNTLAAIQCYNMGYGNMMKILKNYSVDSNKSIDQILSDFYDTGWLNYRDIIGEGDKKYIEHVLSWVGEEICLKNVKLDGSLVNLSVDNKLNTKKVY